MFSIQGDLEATQLKGYGILVEGKQEEGGYKKGLKAREWIKENGAATNGGGGLQREGDIREHRLPFSSLTLKPHGPRLMGCCSWKMDVRGTGESRETIRENKPVPYMIS